MTYIKLKSRVVSQKQPNAAKGFVAAWDGVVCGMIHDGGDEYDEGNFTAPAPREKTDEEKLDDDLKETEKVSGLARKLEEVIDHLVNGTELSQFSKDWLGERKNMRNK